MLHRRAPAVLRILRRRAPTLRAAAAAAAGCPALLSTLPTLHLSATHLDLHTTLSVAESMLKSLRAHQSAARQLQGGRQEDHLQHLALLSSSELWR